MCIRDRDWCSSTLRGVFQNAYFGVTEQIKGVETTIFATVKHYFKNASVYIVSLQCNKTLTQVFHYTRHYETVLQLSRRAFRNTTTVRKDTLVAVCRSTASSASSPVAGPQILNKACLV